MWAASGSLNYNIIPYLGFVIKVTVYRQFVHIIIIAYFTFCIHIAIVCVITTSLNREILSKLPDPTWSSLAEEGVVWG